MYRCPRVARGVGKKPTPQSPVCTSYDMSDFAAAETDEALQWFYDVVERKGYSKAIGWTASRVLARTVQMSAMNGLKDPWVAMDLGWYERLPDYLPSRRSKHPFAVACLEIAFKMHMRDYEKDDELACEVLFTIPWDAAVLAERYILATIDFRVYFQCPFLIIATLAEFQGLAVGAVEYADACVVSLSISNTLAEEADPFCVAIASIIHAKHMNLLCSFDKTDLVLEAMALAANVDDWHWKNRSNFIESVMESVDRISNLHTGGALALAPPPPPRPAPVAANTTPAKRPISSSSPFVGGRAAKKTRASTEGGAAATRVFYLDVDF